MLHAYDQPNNSDVDFCTDCVGPCPGCPIAELRSESGGACSFLEALHQLAGPFEHGYLMVGATGGLSPAGPRSWSVNCGPSRPCLPGALQAHFRVGQPHRR